MNAPPATSVLRRAHAVRRSFRRAAFTALALVAALASPMAVPDAGAEGRAEVYRCQHRVADDLLPLAQTALAGEGEAVVDAGTNSVVLIGPPAAVAAAMALLAQQDRPMRTILLHYESTTRSALDAAGVHVAWRAGGGSWSVGTATFPPGDTGAVVALGARAARGTDRLSGILRVVEGQSGRITTGVSVPLATRRGGNVSTEYVTAESGYDARGRVLGDGRVQVDVAPLLSRLRRDGTIAFTGGETSLVLKPGETVVLGGIVRSGSLEDAGLEGARTRAGEDDTLLLLRAEIE
jgi:type II secretory pathway component HofQ